MKMASVAISQNYFYERTFNVIEDTFSGTYGGWKFHPVVQVSEPEEVREHMSDVKRIELFISQIQQTEDVDVVLIPSAKTEKKNC